jgi:hypothetical protein
MTKPDRIGVIVVAAVLLAVVAFSIVYSLVGHAGECKNTETGRWTSCGQRHDG